MNKKPIKCFVAGVSWSTGAGIFIGFLAGVFHLLATYVLVIPNNSPLTEFAYTLRLFLICGGIGLLHGVVVNTVAFFRK